MTDTPPRHKRSGLFAPIGLFLIVLIAWSVWWFVLAGQVRERLDARIESLRATGWDVAYSGMNTSGWPFRVRIGAENVRVTAPSGHALAAPDLAAEANAWNPDRWVMVSGDGLVLTRAGKGDVAINGRVIRASVSGLTQAWPNVAVELADVRFTSHRDAEVFPISQAERIEAYLRPHLAPAGTEGVENSVDVLFRLIDAEGRPGGPVEGMARNGKLTLQIETVIEDADRLQGADAAGVFSAWTRAGGRFTNVRGEVSAGESRATLASEVLSARPDGRLEGTLSLNAQRPMAAIAGLAGSRDGAVDRAGAAGAAAASTVEGGEDVDIAIVFRDGRTFLGPFALAPAPKLF
ncbi:hypothetical protein IP78_11995 [Brevundimonas sp. AAP58]|uniref:DUF2125 domain-containing protein n=1 Tax=Brevundimonas sp. AAP58 TaxID=1523422 RepID=UPI0006B8FB3D|nr:DUF2125 domain-containing protein [Brevundimonas sp. AAP58]KPF77805.1 hypothetical protein IP78_11995 [Brevundimonas sp. AAP58]